MSTQPIPVTSNRPIVSRTSLTAGSAFKFGFFAALGVFVFYLVISIVLGVIGLVLLATGLLATTGLPKWLTGG